MAGGRAECTPEKELLVSMKFELVQVLKVEIGLNLAWEHIQQDYCYS